MPGYFLLSILRNLARNKLYSLINLASLSIGLAVFAFAFLYVKQELGFDRAFPNAAHILRLTSNQKGVPGDRDGNFDLVNARAFPALTQNFSDEIDKATRMVNILIRPKDSKAARYRNLAIVDPAFADIFQLEVVSGSLKTALEAPGFIAVEESVAASYPEPMQVGSRITFESNSVFVGDDGKMITGSPVEYQVAAIFRLPKDVSGPVHFEMITLLHEYSAKLFVIEKNILPWDWDNRVWLTLKPGVDAKAFEARMPEFIDRALTGLNDNLQAGDHLSAHLQYHFQGVTDLHFHALPNEYGAGDMSRMLTIAAIGILVLLVGCSNSISLSLASVLERRREMGIHKAVGALQKDILLQYLGESVLLSLLAVVPAFALVEWLLPPFLTLLNIRQALQPGLSDYLVIPLIAVLVGLASGAYPALVLSRVKPQSVLKLDNAGSGGSQRIRSLLVGFQFCFALTLMISTLALSTQLLVVRGQPIGFNADNLVYINNTPEQWNKSAALLQELRKIPGVLKVVATFFQPLSNPPASLSVIPMVNKNQELVEAQIQSWIIDPGFFDIMQIPLLAGRMLDAATNAQDALTDNKSADQGRPETRMVLNRTAVKALGFASVEAAVNQTIYQRFHDENGKLTEVPVRVVGVVEDSLYDSLRRKPTPQAYGAASPDIVPIVLLKFEDGAQDRIPGEIKQVWQQLTGTPPQSITFFQPILQAAFLNEQNESRLLLYCAGLALFLSCIGLYGLAAFTMERRIKEVGVRKVMGASSSAITALFLWRYARPVLLAALIACPIAVYFVLQWMERFPYQMDKLWLLPLCVAACSMVLVIALLTVAGIVIRAASERPMRSLRYE